MGVMEKSSIAIAPLLIRNLITSIFIFADKSLLHLSQNYRLIQFIRHTLLSSFLFFLRSLASLLGPNSDDYPLKPPKNGAFAAIGGAGDSGIARALSQLLSIVNDIPVNSRKYEVVRSLAERLIDDNRREDAAALDEVNRTVLSAAFERTLMQLEAAMIELGRHQVNGDDCGPVQFRLNRVLKLIRSVGGEGTGKGREGLLVQCASSAEKLAAELLWLAPNLESCGFVEEAVCRWASASNVAWLALSAEPRLQGSLVKITAFLFKQAKDLGMDETDESRKEQQKETKMKMLVSWVPLLCRGSNGSDAPVLSSSERAELERVLEETIEMLEKKDEQERVLSLWLHHFTYCPSSDWPNLHASYARWCTASRKLLILR